ncbi:MAG: ethanolamine ammonia-lyase subunit EutB [Bacteroidota bacterium]
MHPINRRKFLFQAGILGLQYSLLSGCTSNLSSTAAVTSSQGVVLQAPRTGEDILTYIQRTTGQFDSQLYRQIIGAANSFKEGDQALGLAAANDSSRRYARTLLSNTPINTLQTHRLYEDAVYELISQTTPSNEQIANWTFGQLKTFLLSEEEVAIKTIMPALSSDVIGCVVKLMSNEELIQIGQKVFNPLPGSQIGAKGYMSARVQPNSPTDNIDDIIWQVFDAWSYGVGDLVLGTNPVSSEPDSVAKIEAALLDILTTFGLEETLPNCVLSHIDIQAEVEDYQPGTTGVWFQSLAGTVGANQTFDVTVEKMLDHAAKRTGKYGMYFETGQGADFTNGHGEGFDMLLHESRKYGFARALKQKISEQNAREAWVHLNDVAGFIGPEVFKSKEQLVRCCLEDTVMGKLHGLAIGLDICSTLHMDVTLEDLDWCIEQVMPANPAYLMALPTKNDPMLSYLTTSFSDHVRIREQFGYKINDAMWDFFKKLGIIDENNQATEHFGDPIWVYYQYCRAKGDTRSKDTIYRKGKQTIAEIRERGVFIAEGYGENIWDLPPALDKEVHALYEDAKVSIWTEMQQTFVQSIPAAVAIKTQSKDRKDYVYHPESGEQLSAKAVQRLEGLRQKWGTEVPDIQLVISDGLNPRSITDNGHLMPFVKSLKATLEDRGYRFSASPIVITHGRVRAGYACGEKLFSESDTPKQNKGIIHIIGERPGTGHHNFSAYLTATSVEMWSERGKVDHNISRVVSGISDTAFDPVLAAQETAGIFDQLFSTTS